MKRGTRCPLWVKSRHVQRGKACPLGLGQLHLNVEFKASNRAGIAMQLAAKFYPKKRRRRATQLLLWLSVKCKRTLIASSAKGIAYRRR